jgi:hypothetical protein
VLLVFGDAFFNNYISGKKIQRKSKLKFWSYGSQISEKMVFDNNASILKTGKNF